MLCSAYTHIAGEYHGPRFGLHSVPMYILEEAEENEHSNSRLSSWHFFLRSISIHTGPILEA